MKYRGTQKKLNHAVRSGFGFIPNNANPGAYPGALSRYDNATEICSSCGQAEGMSGLF